MPEIPRPNGTTFYATNHSYTVIYKKRKNRIALYQKEKENNIANKFYVFFLVLRNKSSMLIISLSVSTTHSF